MNSINPCRFNAYFHAICATAITLAFTVRGRTVPAVDGDLDPAFGTNGKVLTDFDHSTDIANAVAIQTDGKLIVVGTTYQDNDFSAEDFAVARYNPDGTLDKTFGAGGKVQSDFPGLAAVASSIVIQPDGKIMVAGAPFRSLPFSAISTDSRATPDSTAVRVTLYGGAKRGGRDSAPRCPCLSRRDYPPKASELLRSRFNR